MEIKKLLAGIANDMKNSEAYQNLSDVQQEQIDNILNNLPLSPSIIEGRKKQRNNHSITSHCYQIKISLKGAKPPIWRRVLVPGNITFHQLHEVIQISMGWENYHLYSFNVDDVLIEQDNEDFFEPLNLDKADSAKETLEEWIAEEKEAFLYTYDFGDEWIHRIFIEKITVNQERLLHPICIKGKRACPPEDCGGIYGYSALLEVLNENDGAGDGGLEEILAFYGDFKPDEFDIDSVNQQLRKIKL